MGHRLFTLEKHLGPRLWSGRSRTRRGELKVTIPWLALSEKKRSSGIYHGVNSFQNLQLAGGCDLSLSFW